MIFSRSIRLIIVWIAVPLLFVQAASSTPNRGHPMQIESPIALPQASPLLLPDSPIAAPTPSPTLCTAATPCDESTVTPTATQEFNTFLPGVGQQPGSAGSVPQPSAPPPAPPDLGTVLNYVAVGVIVVGVTLKIYWFIADRRKGTAK
jgi:hypothetical protein